MNNNLKIQFLANSKNEEDFQSWMETLSESELDSVAELLESDIYDKIAKCYGVPSVLC